MYLKLISQGLLVRSFQTNQSRVTIDALNPCLSYWVVVTAIDCTSRFRSSPIFVELFDPAQFQFEISIQDAAPCRVWVADNFATKISDIQQTINSGLEDSGCGRAASCMANSRFTCDGDSSIINYEWVIIQQHSIAVANWSVETSFILNSSYPVWLLELL